jgi:uncharacterized membrane protein
LKPTALLDAIGLELGSNVKYNRKYLAELTVIYSFLAIGLYTALSILAPLLIKSGNELIHGIAALTYIFNVYMCHQMPQRSFFLGGEQLSLCARCVAIFIGAFLAFPSASLRKRFPSFMNSWLFVIAALIPIAVDGITQFFGLRESTVYYRFSTGFIAAFAVVYFLVATILNRFATGKTFFRKGIMLPVSIPFAFLVISILVAGFFIGTNYMSADQALEKAKQSSPNAAYYEVRYIAPHATRSIAGDQYIETYNDPILHDVDRNYEFRRHQFGAWAVLALTEPSEHYGRHIYLSAGSGDYYYYDAWTGELILHTQH